MRFEIIKVSRFQVSVLFLCIIRVFSHSKVLCRLSKKILRTPQSQNIVLWLCMEPLGILSELSKLTLPPMFWI